MRSRLKLIVSYDGASFSGWQSQTNRNTIQDCLEGAFQRICSEPVRVHGAGRTDAGVHALAQCAHLDLPTRRYEPGRWVAALNGVLPPTIRVLRCGFVSDKFHARFSAKEKTYRYRIWNAAVLPPFECGRAWHVVSPLDFPAMVIAAREFGGQHDFVSFSANRGTPETDTIRTMRAVRLRRAGPCISLEFDGDGFLYKMVRMMVGTLARIGLAQATRQDIKTRLAHPQKSVSRGRTAAPASGLFLVRVRYDFGFAAPTLGRFRVLPCSGRIPAFCNSLMTPIVAPTVAPAPASPATKGRQGIVGRSAIAWLFSPKHFHLKLLSGTAVGIVVITFLAGLFLFVTVRNHRAESLRTHTITVMRLGSVIANDVAALEASYRGFLLTGENSDLEPFERRRELIKHRVEELTVSILDNPRQRKRVMKIQEIVQKWLDDVALPQVKARQTKGSTEAISNPSDALGDSLLEQAREILQSLQNEEQIVLNQRMQDQEWAAQPTQVLDLLTKLERSLIEMEKEKRGYLLAGGNDLEDAYKKASTDFYTCHGYLSILIANSPERSEALANIRKGVEKWVSTSAAPEMEAKRAGKDVAALLKSNKGEELMTEVRELLKNFERSEIDGYEVRANATARERIIRTSALAILCVFAVGLLIASNSYSFVLVRRQLAKLEGVETRIRSIIENILDGMVTVDEQGVICSMNPSAEKMFGCINNEMVGHKFTKLVPKLYGNEGETVACAWDDLARQTGSTTMAVGRTRRHATFPIEISLSEMVVDRQKLFVAMIRDVTERKRFEMEMAGDKESLAVTLRSIEDGVITTDVQGKIIMINKAGENLTGWSSKEAIGQPLKSVFNISIDLVAQARAQKSGYRNEAHSILLSIPENATLRSRDGSEHIIEEVASPIRDSKNEVAGVVLVFRDITERQRDEAERRKAEALEQLGLLAGGIAHDFNNLLTAIIGNISLATLVLPPEDEMATRLNDAKNASMRARDLAQQLLTFARGGAPIKKTASIGKLIQDTVSFSLRGSHSRSEFLFGVDLWPADIDPGQISQVIANLVVNADQAMPNGGTLRVSCDNFTYQTDTVPTVPDLLPGDYIRIAIRDEGVGIPENCLKRIFDPYFTTKAKGNGLGLATTYSIMKNHNGLICVDSQIHYGSTFTLYLPASKNQEMPAEPPRQLNQVISGTGRVLIVDDEEAIRALVEFTLERLGYQVTGAESALEGVEIYRQKLEAGERFDLVILDLTLPGGMGGKDALKKLIEIDPTVNAIVSSGYALDATMSRYQDHGFRGVIAKPYEAAELGKIVHEVIASSHINIVPDYEMQAAV